MWLSLELMIENINKFHEVIYLSSGNRNERSGMGRGQQPRGRGLGPEGICVCPKCGNKVPHQRGIPCTQMDCSKCGSKMFRE